MKDLFVGQIWKKGKIERKIIDLVHDGFYPDDPNDNGSFEEFQVWYEDGRGKRIIQLYEFEDWVENAECIFEPETKIGFRDEI